MDKRYSESLAAHDEAAAAKQDSDNGGDAVLLAREHMIMGKDGQYCPHGIEYTTGRLHPQHPDAGRVFGYTLIGYLWDRICPCCCRVLPSHAYLDDDGQAVTNGGYCGYCELEPGFSSRFPVSS